MNFEYFISRRIRSKKGVSFSRPIIKVSIAGISLGLTVMLISVAILQGCQKQVRDKVAGFGAHIQVTAFDSNNSFEPSPIHLQDVSIEEIAGIPGVAGVHPFCLKAGIIKTEEEIHGVVLKGVESTYDWSFFSEKLVSGHLPDLSTDAPSGDVLISSRSARLLGFAPVTTCACTLSLTILPGDENSGSAAFTTLGWVSLMRCMFLAIAGIFSG